MLHPRSIGLLVCCTAVACGNDVDVPLTRVTVEITDAPHDLLASAIVHIGGVELIGPDGVEIVLAADGGMHDLLALQDGRTAEIARLDVLPGTYRQLRLHLLTALVTMKAPHLFPDGEATKHLVIPTRARDGVTINLLDVAGRWGLDFAPGDLRLVIDFDVAQSFAAVNDPTPPFGLLGISFSPRLRPVVRDGAGTITGTVRGPPGESVSGLIVTANQTEPVLLERFQTETVTAVTDTEGRYTLTFLRPGTYEVRLDQVTTEPETHVVPVELEQLVEDVDFSVSN